MRLFAVVFLILASLSFAADACSPVDSVADYATGEYAALPIAVLFVTIVFLSIAKTLSGAFGLPQLDAWIKNEVREVIVTAVLLVIFLAFIASSDLIVKAFVDVDCTKTAAEAAVGGMLGKLATAYESIIKAAARLRFVSTYSSYASLGFVVYAGFSLSRYGGVYPLVSSLMAAAGGMTNAVFLYKAIAIFLDFFFFAVPHFLFPVAFSFRAFPLTRSLGNTLIAVALGLAIFFPLSVILVGQLNDVVGVPSPSLAPKDLSVLAAGRGDYSGKGLFSVFCTGVIGEVLRTSLAMGESVFAAIVCAPLLIIPGAFPACFNLVANVIYPLLASLSSLGLSALVFLSDVLTMNFDVEKAFDIVYAFLKDVNTLAVVSYVNVLLIGLITVSGIRSVSTALGGEMYLPGVEKLI